MKTLIKNLLIPLFLLSSLISYAGTIDPSVPDEEYINYAKDFKYVYKICGTYKNGGLFCASAVAINSHWVVTAAHVVKDYQISFVHKEDKAYLVRDVIVHEDFDDKKFGFGDIALVYVADNLGLDFYPELYTDGDEVGKICSISGYGFTGTFITGSIKSDDLQRAGSNHIDSVENDLLICSAIKGDKKTSLEFLICSGDSGGGLFIGNKLAGINSCVFADDKKPNSNYGDQSGHTRVSKYAQWIKDRIQAKK